MTWFQRLLGILIAIPLLIGAFVFASLVLAVGAVLALLIWAWLWWNTRKLRRAMARHRRERFGDASGEVIEGEYREERDSQRIER
jgi:uncharacterized membrane protein